MKIPKTFMLLSFLVVCFSTSLSWGNYNDFPMDDPEVTGTFMEYRTGHFHGGIDLISRQSNNIVRLFEGFDRINNTTDRHLAFYSLARVLKNKRGQQKDH